MKSARGRAALDSFLLKADGPGTKPPDSRTDTAIMNATAAVISEYGERNLTIDQVAERAGFTRMTVFRRFGSREQLLHATYTNELRKVLDAVAAAADSVTNRLDRAEIVVAELLSAAENNPITQRLANVEPAAIVELWRDSEVSGHTWGVNLIAHLLRDELLEDPLDEDEATFAGNLLMRLVVSLLLVPDPTLNGPSAARKQFLRAMVERVLPHPTSSTPRSATG
ncbi:TetR/AcrR family transcriptional regulator [Nocardia asteroides]|uniref:TetR/AcrR family transcriptional regulator n=1 Tax=Nocardia asteroides TaxID=1824 RepID=UPI001E37B4E3|nr:TetR/AcrR family transcriptional regulator [Nocardia asteroides]UGT55139.1 TetR/AcrR family transcriptional regulator [Nocardia asteroides]